MTPEKITAPEDMQRRYRNVFGTAEGRIVLGDICLTLCHFSETLVPTDQTAVAEYNIGLTILRMAGGLDLLYGQLGITVKEK